MDCHLVTVEVRIERGTSKRMQLDSLTLDHSWLESLDTESVKCRRTVKKYRMPLHHILEDIPDHRVLPVDNLLGRLDGLHNTSLDQFPDDERFVKLCGHEFRKTALMHLKLRSYDDN